jgi:hypothetical protein
MSHSFVGFGVAHDASDRKESPTETRGEFAVDAARKTNHHHDREEPERDQIPRTVIREDLPQRKVQKRTDDRAFDRSDAADDHREEQQRNPVHPERGIGRDAQRAQNIKRAGTPGSERGEHVYGELHPTDVDALTFRGDGIVARRGECETEPRPQQQVHAAGRRDQERDREPKRGGLSRALREREHRREADARAAPERGDVCDEQTIDFRDHPRGDREVVAVCKTRPAAGWNAPPHAIR